MALVCNTKIKCNSCSCSKYSTVTISVRHSTLKGLKGSKQSQNPRTKLFPSLTPGGNAEFHDIKDRSAKLSVGGDVRNRNSWCQREEPLLQWATYCHSTWEQPDPVDCISWGLDSAPTQWSGQGQTQSSEGTCLSAQTPRTALSCQREESAKDTAAL